MHKTDIEKLALQLCIDRYKIFISFCSADIDKVGDIITVESPNGAYEVEITKIN